MNVTYHAGTRVRITGLMPEEPDPIPVGECGTVAADGPNEFGQLNVRWDTGRRLLLLVDHDPFEVVS